MENGFLFISLAARRRRKESWGCQIWASRKYKYVLPSGTARVVHPSFSRTCALQWPCAPHFCVSHLDVAYFGNAAAGTAGAPDRNTCENMRPKKLFETFVQPTGLVTWRKQLSDANLKGAGLTRTHLKGECFTKACQVPRGGPAPQGGQTAGCAAILHMTCLIRNNSCHVITPLQMPSSLGALGGTSRRTSESSDSG